MPSPTRISDQAVETLAKRYCEAHRARLGMGDIVAWDNLGGHLREPFRKQAREDLEAIHSLLCGPVEEEARRKGREEGLAGYDGASAREAAEHQRAEKAEQELEQVRKDHDDTGALMVAYRRQLSQVREEVENAERDSELGNGGELEDPLANIKAILDSSPSLLGDPLEVVAEVGEALEADPPRRVYEIYVCPKCGKQLHRSTESCVDGHPNSHAVSLKVAALEPSGDEENRSGEVQGKLQAGYSLCHPEDDCAGQRAWLKAAGERDQLREIVDDAIPVIDRLFEFFATSGLSEEGGGLALHEASKPLADLRVRLTEATQQQPTTPVSETGPGGDRPEPELCPECGSDLRLGPIHKASCSKATPVSGERTPCLTDDGLCPVCHHKPDDRGFVNVERQEDGRRLGAIYCWHYCHGPQLDYRGRTLVPADTQPKSKDPLSVDQERLEEVAGSLERAADLARESRLPATARIWAKRAEEVRDLASRLSVQGERILQALLVDDGRWLANCSDNGAVVEWLRGAVQGGLQGKPLPLLTLGEVERRFHEDGVVKPALAAAAISPADLGNVIRTLLDALANPGFGSPTGVHCEDCGREQLVGDEGWESVEMVEWCPDCFHPADEKELAQPDQSTGSEEG